MLVIDAWHETHASLARRYAELCREHTLDCRLWEAGPAEIHTAVLCESECGDGHAVVKRCYDAALRAERCVVLIFQRGRFWRVVAAR